MPDQQVDLAVVGLGAMGAAVAWQAARRGLTVTAFDALEPPHALGSSHGHSRIIREAYFEHPQYVPLVQRAYALWARLETDARTRLFQACGGLMVGHPGRVLVDGTLAGRRRARAARADLARGGGAATAWRRWHPMTTWSGSSSPRGRAGAGARGGRDAGSGSSGWRTPAVCPSP